MDRFKAYGLEPWGNAKEYEQSILIGANVIGVLPGSDAQLSNEVVLVSAHYDHEGKGLLGAADNASGVAVLLEVAERLSRSSVKPRRTICFAAFDREESMAYGAFAFTCRDDFDSDAIAAVVNIDMLGRQFLDVVENTVFLIGTEHYRDIRYHLNQLANTHHINVLPVGADVAGPRGDHVAFLAYGMPCLFFSCGEFSDYHEKTDTAEKLDYALIHRSAGMILDTVQHVADVDTIETYTPLTAGDRDELMTLRVIASNVTEHSEMLGLDDTGALHAEEITSEINRLLAKTEYFTEERETLLQEMKPMLYDLRYGSSNESGSEAEDAAQTNVFNNISPYAFLDDLFKNHGNTLTELYRDAVRSISKRSLTGLVLKGIPHTRFVRYEVPDDCFVFRESKEDQCRLSMLLLRLNLCFHKRPLWRRSGELFLSAQWDAEDVIGTKDDIIDYCILHWGFLPDNPTRSAAWSDILTKLTDQETKSDYDDWVSWRLKRLDLRDIESWYEHAIERRNPELTWCTLRHLIRTKSPFLQGCAHRVLVDTTRRSDCREIAMRRYGDSNDRESLLTLVDLLGDETLVHQPNTEPLYEDPLVVQMINKHEALYGQKKSPKSLGEVALKRLKELTNEDFGSDQRAWRIWING